MKNLKLIAATLLCATSLCTPAMAQSSPLPPPLPEEQRATAGQISTLFDTMRIKDQLTAVQDLIPLLLQQQMQKQREALGGRKFTPEQEEKIEKFLQRRFEKSKNLYPIEEIITDAGTIYQKYISREQANILIEFYRTPTAQHLLDIQPAMTQEYIPLIMSHIETRIKAFAVETAREAQELLKELLVLENQ